MTQGFNTRYKNSNTAKSVYKSPSSNSQSPPWSLFCNRSNWMLISINVLPPQLVPGSSTIYDSFDRFFEYNFRDFFSFCVNEDERREMTYQVEETREFELIKSKHLTQSVYQKSTKWWLEFHSYSTVIQKKSTLSHLVVHSTRNWKSLRRLKLGMTH